MTTTQEPDVEIPAAERIEYRLTTGTLAGALAAFQLELPKVKADNTAQVKSDKGNYSYRYADLSDLSPLVLPLLAKHGLAWMTQPLLIDDGHKLVLRYTLAHTSGEVVTGDYPLPAPGSSPQVLGSAITYARRYTLCAVTGVAPGDDDDDAAAAQRPPNGQTNGHANGATNGKPQNGAATNGTTQRKPTPAQLRSEIAKLGKAKGYTEDALAKGFAKHTDGGEIGRGTAIQLTTYLEAVRKAEPVKQAEPAAK